MDDTAGSRTGSKESHSRDSELTPEAVTRDTAQVEESPQQTTPDGDRPRRRIFALSVDDSTSRFSLVIVFVISGTK